MAKNMTTVKALALWALAVGAIVGGWYLVRGFPPGTKDLEEIRQQLSKVEGMEQQLSKVQAELTETNRGLNETRAKVEEITKRLPPGPRPPSPPRSEITPIGSISCPSAGKDGIITVAGTIAEREDGRNRVELRLSDNTGTITVPIFANTRISTDRLRKGASITVHSYVQCHNQMPEIVPERAADIIYQSAQ